MGADGLGWVLIRTIHPAESWQRIPSRPGQSQGVKSLKNFSAKIFLETLPRPLTLTKAWGTNQSRFSRADCWFVRYVFAPLFAWQTIPAGTKPSRGSRGRTPCKRCLDIQTGSLPEPFCVVEHEGFSKRSFEKPLSARSSFFPQTPHAKILAKNFLAWGVMIIY